MDLSDRIIRVINSQSICIQCEEAYDTDQTKSHTLQGFCSTDCRVHGTSMEADVYVA